MRKRRLLQEIGAFAACVTGRQSQTLCDVGKVFNMLGAGKRKCRGDAAVVDLDLDLSASICALRLNVRSSLAMMSRAFVRGLSVIRLVLPRTPIE